MKVLKQIQALILPPKRELVSALPGGKLAKVNGKTWLAVRHGVEETKILRRLGIAAPAPMLLYYKWARKPWRIQQDTAAMLTLSDRAYCLNDMGTGKTFTTLAAADYLISAGVIRRVLVVAPLSTLEATWRDELFSWFTRRSCAILHGTAKKRRALLEKPFDFYLINHDGIEVVSNELAKRKDIDLVIIDELATYRYGRDSYKTTILDPVHGPVEKLIIPKRNYHFIKRALVGRKYVWGLTGAPCPNAPTDAWAQCRLVTPNTVPWSFTRFRDQTMFDAKKADPFATDDYPLWKPKPDALAVVVAAMSPSRRYKLADAVGIPPVVYETRSVPMGKLQQRAYDMLKSAITRVINVRDADGRIRGLSAANEAVAMQRFAEIASGFVYDPNKNVIDLDPVKRMQEMVDTITQTESKVIVFAPFKHTLSGISRALDKAKISHAVVNSAVKLKQRSAIFSAFQHADHPKVLVAQPKTMSHGLTLIAASVIVWFAPHRSNDVYTQANRRISRPGQTRGQVIVHLSGSPVEARMYRNLREQGRMQGTLLDLFEERTRTGESFV